MRTVEIGTQERINDKSKKIEFKCVCKEEFQTKESFCPKYSGKPRSVTQENLEDIKLYFQKLHIEVKVGNLLCCSCYNDIYNTKGLVVIKNGEEKKIYSDIFNYYNIYIVTGNNKNNDINISLFKNSLKQSVMFISSCGILGHTFVKSNIEFDFHSDFNFSNILQYWRRIDRFGQTKETFYISICTNEITEGPTKCSEFNVVLNALRKFEVEKFIFDKNYNEIELGNIFEKYFPQDDIYIKNTLEEFKSKFDYLNEDYDIVKIYFKENPVEKNKESTGDLIENIKEKDPTEDLIVEEIINKKESTEDFIEDKEKEN
jgi:hypothetical protein